MKPEKKLKKYLKHYNEGDFKKKISKLSGKLGNQLLVYVLVMYELIKDKDIPKKTRLIFVAALGYFILPTDLIADFLPALGFTDDLAFITYAISNASVYITSDVLDRAKEKSDKLFKKNKDLPLSETT